jgi:hypothetical protein
MPTADGSLFRSRCLATGGLICLSETSASSFVYLNDFACCLLTGVCVLLIRYGRKLSQKELMNKDLDGEEAEELAGGVAGCWLPCVEIFLKSFIA